MENHVLSPDSVQKHTAADQAHEAIKEGIRNISKSQSRAKVMRRKKITLVETPLEKCKQNTGLHFQLQRDLKVGRKFLLKCQENSEENCPGTKKRKGKTKKITENFYNRGDINKDQPSTKTVSKKTMQPTRYMETTLTDAHRQFSAENPNAEVSSVCCLE